MRLHIIGICGSFMGSLALLARQLGWAVSGCDANIYPPMSTQLADAGIEVLNGYDPAHLDSRPELVLVGNAISRGNPVLERVLDEGMDYQSGPQWLARHVLRGKWVLGVAGTHGKTSTSAMLAWILEYAGLKPGFLIGGVTNNFPVSARLGDSAFFVVEADEYDSAFSDKRSKFIHYAPRTTILNNLEFDHADIFDDLAAIQRQFHHLLRILPGNGRLVLPADEPALEAVLAQGCWTPAQRIGIGLNNGQCGRLAGEYGVFWNIHPLARDGGKFELAKHRAGNREPEIATIAWGQTGTHNLRNAAAAIAAAEHADVPPAIAAEALGSFRGVKRRLELRGEAGGISIYDDFAHHPTAIATTVEGLAAKLTGTGRIIAVIEPRSNTMKAGVHQDALAASVQAADQAIWFQPRDGGLDCAALATAGEIPSRAFDSVEAIIGFLAETARPGDHILIMSNGAFGGIHGKLLERMRMNHTA